MKKIYALVVCLCLWLTISNVSFVIACTEDCEKQCNYNTTHAIGDIRESCKEWIDFSRKICIMAGGGDKCREDSYSMDQCTEDSKKSYYKNCMEGCDKCKDDKDFGCFINLPYFK